MGSLQTEGSAPTRADHAAGRDRSCARDPRIGLVVDDRYLLAERVGAGGMGVVYRAEHRYTGEVVAVKLLAGDVRGGASWDEIQRRFLKEPHLLALARHPNVPRVIDAGVAAGQPYLVTEYVEGEDLQQRLDARGALAVDETLAILDQAARALDAAHERGVVHRDVKPANVLIRTDGHVFLTDFGVAKDSDWSAGTVLFIGTTYYAAPEQITLDGVVDSRADVYALGAVMFHCLTGRPPYQGSSPYDVMSHHVREPAPAASRYRPGLPTALDDVIARALAKDPADRYSGCAELVADAAAAAGADIGAVSVPPPDPARRAPPRATGLPVATYPYATAATRTGAPVPPRPRRSAGRRLRRPVAMALLGLATPVLLLGALPSDLGREGGGAGTSGHTAKHGKHAAPAPAASEFTGYAAQLASTFPDQISSNNCGVEPDVDYPEALVLIRCFAQGGQIEAYYELWPSRASMDNLLDENRSGLNVYFAGTWTDANGVPQGRIDRFVAGLLNPRNVILWSYSTLRTTIWAQSTMSQDELLAWWRTTAPRAATQSQA